MRVLKAIFFSLMFTVLAFPARSAVALQIKGESLTPSGETVSLLWQVKQRENTYRFYLRKQLKAEMILKGGKVVGIRRRVRAYGVDKWIVITDPLQISIELKSGFYPFYAIMNFRNKGVLHSTMTTGKFEIVRSAAQ